MHSKRTDNDDSATRAASRLTRERSRWAARASAAVSLAVHGALFSAAPSCGMDANSRKDAEVLLEVEEVTLADAPAVEANEDRTHVASPDQQVRPTDVPDAAPSSADDAVGDGASEANDADQARPDRRRPGAGGADHAQDAADRRRPDRTALESSDPSVADARPTADGAADPDRSSPDRPDPVATAAASPRAADGAADPRDPRTATSPEPAPDALASHQAPPDAPPTSTDDALADAAPPTPDDAPRPRDTLKEKDRKAATNPNPLEPRLKIPDLFKQYVHTDAASAPSTGSGDWISANHANAPTHRAADASSTAGAPVAVASGRASPTVNGQQRVVEQPASQRGETEAADGTESSPLPDWLRADPTAPAPTRAAQTGATTATAPRAEPSPTSSNAPPAPTLAPAAASAGRPSVAPSSSRVASAAARAVAPAPAVPTVDTPPPSADGWAPTAFRMPPSSPREAVARARDARPRDARAGQQAVAASLASAESRRALSDTAAADPAPVERPQAPSAVPPPKPLTAAESLRAALGWGTRNQDHTTAPKATQGTIGGDATPLGGTATVLPDEPTPDGQAGVSAVATPTGRYVAEVEALVVERWNAIPVPPDQVAMGVSGTVVVELRIDRSGRVLDVRIVKHSGFPILDMQARNAIPERVPRIPHDVPQDVIVERVTMRTRNATPARTAP